MGPELGSEGAVIVEFGRAVAVTFVDLVKALPSEEDDAGRGVAIEARIQRADGDLAVAVAVGPSLRP